MSVAQMVLAAEGDIKLVAEQLSLPGPAVMAEFLLSAQDPAEAATISVALRSMLLLNLLQLLGEVKAQVMSQLPDYSPAETLKALELVARGITDLSAPPQGATNVFNGPAQLNLGDDAVGRISQKLAAYAPASVSADLEAHLRE